MIPLRALGLMWLAAPARALLAGAGLKPLLGAAYFAAPSDYDPARLGPYAYNDLTDARFEGLWRRDLADMADAGVNALRNYVLHHDQSHLPFLDEARRRGVRVVAAVSNWHVLGVPDHIPKLVNEIKGHPAVAAWGLSNEITHEWASCRANVTRCMASVAAAARAINALDPGERPIVITSIFDANFETARSVRRAFIDARMRGILTRRVVLGVNMYFREPAAWHAGILASVARSWFADPALGKHPLVVGEFGRASGRGGEADQAEVVSASLAGLRRAMAEHAGMLGGFVFTHQDETWARDPARTFGLAAANGTFVLARAGAGGPQYRVDALRRKPAWHAFRAGAAGLR